MVIRVHEFKIFSLFSVKCIFMFMKTPCGNKIISNEACKLASLVSHLSNFSPFLLATQPSGCQQNGKLVFSPSVAEDSNSKQNEASQFRSMLPGCVVNLIYLKRMTLPYCQRSHHGIIILWYLNLRT